jgi:photosystem II stability/assembly factor-like uncharacterized protein
MKPWLAKLLLGGLFAVSLLAILIGPVNGAPEMVPTDTRWPTLTVRPTDTRWPTKTPVGTPPGPTNTKAPTITRTPATLKPTDTRWPTATLVPSRTPTLPATPGPLVQSPNIRQIYMIDALNGWAIGDTYLMRTLDGGSMWFNVTPQGLTLNSIGASGYFLTATSGWLLTSLADKDLGTLFRTTDGGRTWTSYNVPFSNGKMQFLSANTGFVMTSLGAGMSKEAVAIYATTNGCVSWTRKYINDPTVTGAGDSLPLGGQKMGMSFRDIWRGWVGGNYPSSGYTYLYVTDNSGTTWTKVSLPLPANYSNAFVSMKAPIFFGAFNAIMPVSLVDGTNNALYFYVTNDAGYKWVITGSVPNGELAYTEFINLNDGVVVDRSGNIHVTRNAGVSWNNVTPNIDLTLNLRGIDFINTLVGWAVQITADGSTTLYKTVDGGKNWKLISSSQPSGSSPTPSATVVPGTTFTPTSTVVPGTPSTPTATLVPSSTPIPPTPGGIVQSPNIRQIDMIDTSYGWALGDTYLMRTTDGGKTWLNVTPKGMSLKGIGANGFFFNANYGWLLTNIANNGLGTLYRTSDGGRTWIAYDVPFSGGQMQFIGTNTGFVMVSLGAGMSKQAIAVYMTTNGGALWTRTYINDPTVAGAGTSLPLSGQKSGMSFRDVWRGWVGGNYPAAAYSYLYVTDNSGKTWSQVTLPLPAGSSNSYLSMEAPTFFGPFNAILPVSINGDNKDLYIYVTNNAGYTWVKTGYVRNGELAYTDFPTLNDGFVWDWSGIIHATNNAGVTWDDVKPNVNFTANLRGMDFVNKTTGWIVAVNADGSTALYKTINGGWTWNLLASGQPPVTPGPSATPTATIAPTSSTPTATLVPTATVGPTPTLTTGPFGVVLVNQSDSLNIRSGPGVSYNIVGTFEYTETSVTRSGSVSGSGINTWYQVQKPGGGTGWVNSYYLTEYIQPVTFCSDARIPVLLDRLQQAVNNSDGKLFASLVSPIHGVDVRLWHYATPINYTTAGAANAFTSATVQNWGAGPSAIDTIGTFASVIQPKIQDVMNAPTYAKYCNDPKYASMFAEPWPGIYTNFNYYSLTKPGTPGFDLDFREWMVGIEYVRGQPYLVAFIHIVWEP